MVVLESQSRPGLRLKSGLGLNLGLNQGYLWDQGKVNFWSGSGLRFKIAVHHAHQIYNLRDWVIRDRIRPTLESWLRTGHKFGVMDCVGVQDKV